MDYLFHQAVVFILMTIYIPLMMAYIIFMVKADGWAFRTLYSVAIIALIAGFPNLVKNYQQYITGHFSGLPEIIAKTQIYADIVVMTALLAIIALCIYSYIIIIKE